MEKCLSSFKMVSDLYSAAAGEEKKGSKSSNIHADSLAYCASLVKSTDVEGMAKVYSAMAKRVFGQDAVGVEEVAKLIKSKPVKDGYKIGESLVKGASYLSP